MLIVHCSLIQKYHTISAIEKWYLCTGSSAVFKRADRASADPPVTLARRFPPSSSFKANRSLSTLCCSQQCRHNHRLWIKQQSKNRNKFSSNVHLQTKRLLQSNYNYLRTLDNSILLFDICLGMHDFSGLFPPSTVVKETSVSVSYQDTTSRPVFLHKDTSNNLEILKVPCKKKKRPFVCPAMKDIDIHSLGYRRPENWISINCILLNWRSIVKNIHQKNQENW